MRDIETLALRDSPVHRIDPRAKLVTFIVYAACIVSFDKHELAGLIPYFLFFAVLLPLSGTPLMAVAGRVAAVLPLAVFIGIFNPFYDTVVIAHAGPIPVTGGMVSLASIILKFALTAGAAIMLVAVTGFMDLCAAMNRLGLPRALTTQLLLLHRYIFILTDEVARMKRARSLRALGSKTNIKVASAMLGNLLLRTWDRAHRIHLAMVSRAWDRGFFAHRDMSLGTTDVVFCILWCSAFVGFRAVNVSEIVGSFVLGVLP